MIRMFQAKKANAIHLKHVFHTIPFGLFAEKNLNLFGSDAYCQGCSSGGEEYNCRKKLHDYVMNDLNLNPGLFSSQVNVVAIQYAECVCSKGMLFSKNDLSYHPHNALDWPHNTPQQT